MLYPLRFSCCERLRGYVSIKINLAAPTDEILRESELTFQQVMSASPSITVAVEPAAPAAAALCSGVRPM